MCREIKFRAKTSDGVHEVVAIEWDFKIVTTKRRGVACNIKETYSFDEVELMQFTGLHDRNGREIYGEDIVKIVALTNDHYQRGATEVRTVRYFMGSPCVCWKEQESGVPIYPLNVNHAIEVIGNKFENPELLE